MTIENHEAWLLHKKPSGDSSAQLIFFTREAGLLSCLFRGGRTPKKQVLLQAFTPIWLAVDTRRDWQYVNRLEILSSPLPLSGVSLFAGLYLNELLYYALSKGESQVELFDAYQFTLKGLATVNDRLVIEALLRRFEFTLLAACGYSLVLTEEVGSGRAIQAQYHYQYTAGQGLQRASQGFSGRTVLTLAQGQFDDLAALKIAKLIMRQAIDHLLGGRKLKSRSLFAGIATLPPQS